MTSAKRLYILYSSVSATIGLIPVKFLSIAKVESLNSHIHSYQLIRDKSTKAKDKRATFSPLTFYQRWKIQTRKTERSNQNHDFHMPFTFLPFQEIEAKILAINQLPTGFRKWTTKIAKNTWWMYFELIIIVFCCYFMWSNDDTLIIIYSMYKYIIWLLN